MGLRISADRPEPAAFGQLQRPTPPPPEENNGAQAPQDAPPVRETDEAEDARAAEETDETAEEQDTPPADRFPAPQSRQQPTNGGAPPGLPGANLDLLA